MNRNTYRETEMTETTQKMVTYFRVSTKSQGASGLGLEAQQAAAEAYAKSVGGRIISEHTEVETGKRAAVTEG
jgi:DNA invertase Pin-like site-specific DNA recombinase